jgi:hypothetical protein
MLGVGRAIFEESVERLEKTPGACSRVNAIPFIEAVQYFTNRQWVFLIAPLWKNSTLFFRPSPSTFPKTGHFLDNSPPFLGPDFAVVQTVL